MNKAGPIIVVEDDEDDRGFFKDVFASLNYENEIIYFEDGESALAYLLQEPIKPFLILSDINMPRLSGMELKDRIQLNEDLRMKCIPYLFFTTTADQQHVIDAYSKSVQGFFVKPVSMESLAAVMRKIIDYWLVCESPKSIR
jgi:response regulator RpfG family c-di-GMP phosphodiesterase